MSLKRRNFIKNITSTAALAGIPFLNAEAHDKKADESYKKLNDQIIDVGEKKFIVETTNGKLRGYRRNSTFIFKGIPYGASTAGVNRFMAPQPVQSWTGIRNALTWGPSAPQGGGRYINAGHYPERDMSSFSGSFTYHWSDWTYSEDCLRINVWTPAIDSPSKRPVLVWLHGGAFLYGSAINLDAYIGENLSASGDVVVCTINHRINGFGFLNLASAGGDQFKDSPNAGMLDIVKALQWIHDNIHQFGGDANNVTIFGQSGGGAKVNILMTMPAAKGLFHKAVNMSGAFLKLSEYRDSALTGDAIVEEARLRGGELNKLQEMSWMDCFDLIEKARVKLLQGRPQMSMMGPGSLSPCVDGHHIPCQPLQNRIAQHIPLIVGNCLNEFSPSADDPELESITFDHLIDKLRSRFKQKTADVVNAYRKEFPSKKPIEIWSMIAMEMRSLAIDQAELHSSTGATVFNYIFEWQTPLYDGRPRAYNNAYIPFWFYNTNLMESMTGGGLRPQRLSEKMSQSLIHFARSGNPNHNGIPNWPAYTSTNGPVMIWDDKCKVMNDPDRRPRKVLNEALNNLKS